MQPMYAIEPAHIQYSYHFINLANIRYFLFIKKHSLFNFIKALIPVIFHCFKGKIIHSISLDNLFEAEHVTDILDLLGSAILLETGILRLEGHPGGLNVTLVNEDVLLVDIPMRMIYPVVVVSMTSQMRFHAIHVQVRGVAI